MTFTQLYIAENLTEQLDSAQIKAIENACQICSSSFYSNVSIHDIMKALKSENEIFVLLEIKDFIDFSNKYKHKVTENFILVPHEKNSPILNNYKDDLKKIRFVLGSPHADFLQISLTQIIQFKKKNNSICNYFDSENADKYIYDVKNSNERSVQQNNVINFFNEKIQAHKEILVAGISSYSKIFGDIADEFLMNAIWDANPNRAKIDRTKSIALSKKERVQLMCFYHNKHFILSVTDKFGSFPSSVIERYFRYALGLKENSDISHNTAGAGLGLFMVLQKVGHLIYEVEKGKITKAIAIGRGDQSMREVQKKPKTILFFEK